MSITKRVALTFDDGPNPPYTNQVLNILKKARIKATFFVCGTNVKRYPEIVKRIAKEGHLIGNHSYNHRYVTTRIGAIYKETIKTQELIEKLITQKDKLFRSPWLAAPSWLENKLKRKDFKIVHGGIVGNDWETQTTSEDIVQKILSQVKNNAIIILHDGYNAIEGADRSKTVEALPKIIDLLHQEDFDFTNLLKLI